MEKTLKTKTLGTKDQPAFVICDGHVDVKTFNKAFKSEGWSEVGKWDKKQIDYVYGFEGKCGFSLCEPNKLKAKKYTVAHWD